MDIETLVLDVIEGRKKAPFLRGAFYVLSLAFQLGVRIRHLLYDRGLFKSHLSNRPVISVGNIVAGGTGKTPFVAKLVKELVAKPGDIAILSRGYRSQNEKGISLQVSKGFGPESSSAICGDEPYWLALETNASIWVGKDRVQSADRALEAGSHLLILEDGFQHRALKRKMDIVLLDGLDLFGKGFFLPRGYLRDSPKRLKKVDYVVVTHLEEGLDKAKICSEIRRYTEAPILGFKAKYSLEARVRGKKVGAFCGIAKPGIFYEALKSEGLELVNTFTSPDHVMPSQEDLELFAVLSKASGAEYLICTEKDFVKYEAGGSLVLPISILKMDLDCIWNENVWKEMIESIKNIK